MKKIEAQLPEVPTPLIRSENVCITYTLFHFKFLLIWCYQKARQFSTQFIQGTNVVLNKFNF